MANPLPAFLSASSVSPLHSAFHGQSLRAQCLPIPRTRPATRTPYASDKLPSESAAYIYRKSLEHLEHLKSKRYPTFRKLQHRHNQGPAAFRQAQAAADALAENVATEVTAPPADLARKTPKRHMMRDGIRLSELAVGMEMVGKVQNLVRHGAYVDVGAVRDGLVHVRDMAIEFVHDPSDLVRTGDSVTVWVKYVNPVTNVLGLSMVKPRRGFTERMPIRDVEIGKRYEGTVERVTNYGAYVDIGAERLGFLHVAAIWGRRPRETLEQLRIGESVWVNVDDVDEIRSHIRLRARGRRHTELRKDGPLGELARMEGDDQADGQEVVIRQAVQRPWSERDEEEDKDGTDEENYEDEDFEDMYEREIEDDMFSDLELLPKDITNMIDGNDEHYDITHFQ